MKQVKATIDKQSHNEVKELLNTYVVSPVNKDINDKLIEIKNSIEETQENTNKKISDIPTSINGCIDRSLKIHFEKEEDLFEELSNTINDNNDNVNSNLNSVIESIENNKTEISNSKTVFEGFIKSSESNLSRKLEESVSKLNDLEKNIQEKLKGNWGLEEKLLTDIQENITDKFNSINQDIKTNHSNINELISQISKSVGDSFQGLNSSVNELQVKISDTNNSLDSLLKGNQEKLLSELTAYKERSNKNHKQIFAILLTFGIVNSIGIIAIILLLLLK